MGGGVFFVKSKWIFPQRRVHYVQYQYFLFYILLIWECVRTQRTPCLRACFWHQDSIPYLSVFWSKLAPE